jgi:hypothetical protein
MLPIVCVLFNIQKIEIIKFMIVEQPDDQRPTNSLLNQLTDASLTRHSGQGGTSIKGIGGQMAKS